jgi:hypothetical protein
MNNRVSPGAVLMPSRHAIHDGPGIFGLAQRIPTDTGDSVASPSPAHLSPIHEANVSCRADVIASLVGHEKCMRDASTNLRDGCSNRG